VSEIPDKLFYKIVEICKYTETQPYVLRFWESEFPQLARTRNRGGQRVYSREDLDLLLKIKKLLSEDEYTIAGVREFLEREEGVSKGSAAVDEPRKDRRAGVPGGDGSVSPPAPTPATEHGDSYKASYEVARGEIELLRKRLADAEEKCREAERSSEKARERSERVAARLESLLDACASRGKKRRSS